MVKPIREFLILKIEYTVRKLGSIKYGVGKKYH